MKISKQAVAEMAAVGVAINPEYDIDEANECRHGVYRGGHDCPVCDSGAVEIIDGKQSHCDDYRATNGLHCRW